MVKRCLIIFAGILLMLSGCGKAMGNEAGQNLEQAAEPEHFWLF